MDDHKCTGVERLTDWANLSAYCLPEAWWWWFCNYLLQLGDGNIPSDMFNSEFPALIKLLDHCVCHVYTSTC